jgi:hypothetical protein
VGRKFLKFLEFPSHNSSISVKHISFSHDIILWLIVVIVVQKLFRFPTKFAMGGLNIFDFLVDRSLETNS